MSIQVVMCQIGFLVDVPDSDIDGKILDKVSGMDFEGAGLPPCSRTALLRPPIEFPEGCHIKVIVPGGFAEVSVPAGGLAGKTVEQCGQVQQRSEPS